MSRPAENRSIFVQYRFIDCVSLRPDQPLGIATDSARARAEVVGSRAQILRQLTDWRTGVCRNVTLATRTRILRAQGGVRRARRSSRAVWLAQTGKN